MAISLEGPSNGEAMLGGRGSFTATGSLSDGSSRVITFQSEWTSSDTSVVMFPWVGIGEAVGVGQSEICATYEGMTGCTLVTVVP